MQYLLSEEEYKALKQARRHEIDLSKSKLQKLCTKIAEEMPIVWGWGSEPEKAHPWGCILSKKYSTEWYCDQCPVTEICPHPNKSWSQ